MLKAVCAFACRNIREDGVEWEGRRGVEERLLGCGCDEVVSGTQLAPVFLMIWFPVVAVCSGQSHTPSVKQQKA